MLCYMLCYAMLCYAVLGADTSAPGVRLRTTRVRPSDGQARAMPSLLTLRRLTMRLIDTSHLTVGTPLTIECSGHGTCDASGACRCVGDFEGSACDEVCRGWLEFTTARANSTFCIGTPSPPQIAHAASCQVCASIGHDPPFCCCRCCGASRLTFSTKTQRTSCTCLSASSPSSWRSRSRCNDAMIGALT